MLLNCNFISISFFLNIVRIIISVFISIIVSFVVSMKIDLLNLWNILKRFLCDEKWSNVSESINQMLEFDYHLNIAILMIVIISEYLDLFILSFFLLFFDFNFGCLIQYWFFLWFYLLQLLHLLSNFVFIFFDFFLSWLINIIIKIFFDFVVRNFRYSSNNRLIMIIDVTSFYISRILIWIS